MESHGKSNFLFQLLQIADKQLSFRGKICYSWFCIKYRLCREDHYEALNRAASCSGNTVNLAGHASSLVKLTAHIRPTEQAGAVEKLCTCFCGHSVRTSAALRVTVTKHFCRLICSIRALGRYFDTGDHRLLTNPWVLKGHGYFFI